MAKTPAKQDKPVRRVIKKAETVREKTEQQTAKSSKNKSGVISLALRYIGMPFRPIGRLLKKLGKYKFFRVIGFIIVPPYFRNSWKELRQVTWPNWKDSWKLTLAVIIFAVIFGALIAGTDFVLDKLFKEVLLK